MFILVPKVLVILSRPAPFLRMTKAFLPEKGHMHKWQTVIYTCMASSQISTDVGYLITPGRNGSKNEVDTMHRTGLTCLQ